MPIENLDIEKQILLDNNIVSILGNAELDSAEMDAAIKDFKNKNNQALLNNADFFSEVTKRTIIETLEEKGIRDLNVVRFINSTLVNEYFYQRAI